MCGLRSNPEKMKEYKRLWAKNHRDVQNRYFKNLRLRTLELLGNKCVYCGCDIPEALEINHINGGGNKEKKERHYNGREFYLDIVSSRRKIDDLELTCIVCNAWHRATKLKGIENRWRITWEKDKT